MFNFFMTDAAFRLCYSRRMFLFISDVPRRKGGMAFAGSDDDDVCVERERNDGDQTETSLDLNAFCTV